MSRAAALGAGTADRALTSRRSVGALLLAGLTKLFEPLAGGGTSYARGGRPAARLQALCLTLALLAGDGELGAADFGALRAELGVGGRELAAGLRELGATCTPVSKKDGVEGGGEAGGHRLYRARLLPPGGGKTLAEAFPKLKVGRRTA